MTRDKIISDLFTGKNFCDCISKMEPIHLREDLKQEVILIICELPDEKIFQLYKEKKLDFYTVRVILNQCISNTSPFAKRYRQHHTGYVENYHVPDGNAELANGELATSDTLGHIKQLDFIKHQHEDLIELEERQLREDIEDMAIDEIDKQYWYNKGLVNLYMKHGNFRSIEKETGIPWQSCYKTIKKTFKDIKQKVTA